MPNSTLKDNLNSDWLVAFSALLPKKSPQRVLVYVESDDDIAFWLPILQSYQGNKITFDLMLPTKKGLEKGKNAVLERSKELMQLNVGTHLIVCLDSDFDYLLQNHTEQSKRINNNDYIFQTYAYSTENIRCYSDSLQTVCVQSVNRDRQKIDFVALMTLYSSIIYNLFIWMIAFRIRGNKTSFSIQKFAQIVKIVGKVNIQQQGKIELEAIHKQCIEEVEQLQKIHPSIYLEIEQLKKTLQTLGLSEETTYLFMQGHTLEDNFVLPFLRSFCSTIQSETEREIMQSAVHETQQKDELNHYRNKLIPIENVLKANTEYKKCFLYQKIQADLVRYIQKFTIAEKG